jgi:alkanesulfonate monooxygenase SsuD/methylene tetrahydromethanopterin reductase-like flavin-dependent oxidoreductase (luciferase family)
VRAAVQFADEYNTVFPTVDEARKRKRVLDDAAREAGREPLRYSMMIGCLVGRDQTEVDDRVARYRELISPEPPPLVGTVDEVAEQLRAYEAAGVERAMLQQMVHEDVEMVGVLGDVAARLR